MKREYSGDALVSKPVFDSKMGLDSLSREELCRLKEQVQDEGRKLKNQVFDVRHAIHFGNPVDQEWYHRLKHAQRHVAKLSLRINTELGNRRRNRAAKEHANFGQEFIETARELLDSETFKRLISVTHDRTKGQVAS